MKRMISIILAAVMLLSLVAFTTTAEADGAVTVSSPVGKPGDTVTVTVSVSGSYIVRSAGLTFTDQNMSFDDLDGLKYQENSAKWLEKGTMEAEQSMSFGWAVGSDVTFTGDILTFKLEIPEDFQGTSASIPVTLVLKKGTTTLLSEANTVTVTVVHPATELTLPQTASIDMKESATATITATVKPENATDEVAWSSSDPTVATVDQDGNVTALKLGTTTITASVEARNLSSSCNLTVTCSHNWSDATCETAKTCSVCKSTDGSALGHNWTEKLQDEDHLHTAAQNCQEKNIYKYDCSRCDAMSETETYEGDKIGPHNFTEKVEDTAHLKEEGKTCKDGNVYYYECSVEGCTEINKDPENTYVSEKNFGSHSFTAEVEEEQYLVPGATCQTVIQYYKSCATCGTVGTEKFDNKAGTKGDHDWATDWSAADGKHFHACKVEGCNERKDEADCSFETTYTTDATKHWKVCTVCKISHGSEAEHASTLEGNAVNYKEPTCTEAGNKAYYKCACGLLFEDALGTKTTTAEAVVINALGHDWTEKLQDEDHLHTAAQNCQEKNIYKYDCSRCEAMSETETYEGDKIGPHSFTEKVEDTAHLKEEGNTCKEGNVYYYECSVEGCTEINKDPENTYVSEKNFGSHSFTAEVEEEQYLVPGATCQTVIQYYKSCATCGTVGTEKFDNKAGTKGNHDWATDWSAADGKHFYACKVEGCNERKDEADCDFSGEYKSDATKHWKVCTVCKTGHGSEADHASTLEGNAVNYKEPTCTEAGNKAYYKCACGLLFEDALATKTTTAEAVVINALGHDWTEKLQDEDHLHTAAQNCQEKNIYKYDCSRCEAISDNKTYEGDKIGPHSFTEKVEDTAHLKEEGNTCKEGNVYYYDCSVEGCTEINKDPENTYVSEKNFGSHSFTAEVEEEQYLVPGATCQTVIQYYKSCATCGTVGTEKFDNKAGTKGNHDWATDWSAADGKHFHACKVEGCNERKDEADCSFETTYTTDAKSHWYQCSVCLVGRKDEATHASVLANHLTNAKDATCTEDGNKAYYTCDCGLLFADALGAKQTNEDEIVIKALGHDWADATCEAPKTCKREGCGITEGEKREHVPSDYRFDRNEHWKVCTYENCGKEMENSRGKHMDADNNAVCDTCGFQYDTPTVEVLSTASQNYGGAVMNESGDSMKDKALTAEDRKAIEDGALAKVWIDVNEDSGASAEVLEKLEKAAPKGYNVEQVMDITLFKQIGYQDTAVVTNLSSEISVTVQIPDSMRSRNKTFKVIRIHDGKADEVKSQYDANTGNLTFWTDRFSTYGIVSKISNPDTTLPKTGDQVMLELATAILVISGVGAVCVGAMIYKKKRKV